MKKIKYSTENKNEGVTKLENLIRQYPFHPNKVYNIYKREREFPFYQIIVSSKMKGYAVSRLVYPHLQDMMRHMGLRAEEIFNIENKVIKHLYSLIQGMGYTETKEYIEMNNEFKEFNKWIKEMYDRLSYYDNKGGWKKVGMDEIDYNDEQSKIYQEKLRKEREEAEKKREELKKNIQENNNNPNKKFKMVMPAIRSSYGGYLLKSEISEKFRTIYGFFNHFPREQDYENLMTSKEFDDIKVIRNGLEF